MREHDERPYQPVGMPMMIHKEGRGYYRPRSAGYCGNPIDAGVFPAERAMAEEQVENNISALKLGVCIERLLLEREDLTRRLKQCDAKIVELLEGVG